MSSQSVSSLVACRCFLFTMGLANDPLCLDGSAIMHDWRLLDVSTSHISQGLGCRQEGLLTRSVDGVGVDLRCSAN